MDDERRVLYLAYHLAMTEDHRKFWRYSAAPMSLRGWLWAGVDVLHSLWLAWPGFFHRRESSRFPVDRVE